MTSRRVARWALIGTFSTGLVAGVLGGAVSDGYTLVPYLAFAGIGIVLTAQRPENRIGWLFLAVGAMAGLVGLNGAVLQFAADHGRPDATAALVSAWLGNILFLPLLVASTTMTILLFPDGLLSRRWRVVAGVVVVATAGLCVIFAFAPELELADGTTRANPLHPGSEYGATGSAALMVLLMLLGIGTLLAVVSAVLRFRRSRGVERTQMKWFVFAVCVCLGSVVVSGLSKSEALNDMVFTVSASLIPLACGLAILRYRLYDIDRIISRTASYAVVTALVLGTYAVVVTAVTRLLPTSSTLAVAAATLVAAAVARPLLRRVQAVVDRRFNRSRYDAERTVETFGERLRTEIAADDVMGDLEQVVRSTLEPKGVTLWVASR